MSTYLLIALGGLLIIDILFFVWLIAFSRRLKKFWAGGQARDLEAVLEELIKKATQLDRHAKETDKTLLHIDTRLAQSIRNVSLVRFNAFESTGGNQSFASALINEHGDGVIISSLFARDRMSLFAKPIINLASTYELSEEEKNALKTASENIKKTI